MSTTTESGATPCEFRKDALADCNAVADALSGEPEIAQLKAEVHRLRVVLVYANRRIADGCVSDANKTIADALAAHAQP